MAELNFLNKTYTVDDYDTVLNTLLKNGHAVPNACRGGHCHSCLMKATSGQPMPFSQLGLDPSLVDEGYFLACQCMIYADINVCVPDKDKRTRFTAMVAEKTQLSDHVVRLRLQPARDFAYKAGQYLTLSNANGISEDYPVASIHLEDALMEFHISRDGNKKLDHYIFEQLDENDALEVQTAFTEHHYQQQYCTQDLLLIACDADLAGAYGLLREALHLQHQGNIHLLHIQRTPSSRYLKAEISELNKEQGKVNFTELAISAGTQADDINSMLQEILNSLENLNNSRCFLWFDHNEGQSGSKDKIASNISERLKNMLDNENQLITMTA